MSGAAGANPARGEAALTVDGVTHVIRPSFAALVAAEGELGPLFALVERAAAGALTLGEVAALLWHCIGEGQPERERVGAAIVEMGLAGVAPMLRLLLRQILAGR